jgi:hypothetical protein
MDAVNRLLGLLCEATDRVRKTKSGSVLQRSHWCGRGKRCGLMRHVRNLRRGGSPGVRAKGSVPTGCDPGEHQEAGSAGINPPPTRSVGALLTPKTICRNSQWHGWRCLLICTACVGGLLMLGSGALWFVAGEGGRRGRLGRLGRLGRGGSSELGSPLVVSAGGWGWFRSRPPAIARMCPAAPHGGSWAEIPAPDWPCSFHFLRLCRSAASSSAAVQLGFFANCILHLRAAYRLKTSGHRDFGCPESSADYRRTY